MQLSFSANICSYVRGVRERMFVNTCSSMFAVNVCSQTCSFGSSSVKLHVREHCSCQHMFACSRACSKHVRMFGMFVCNSSVKAHVRESMFACSQ